MPKISKKIKEILKNAYTSFFFYLFRVFPIEKNKIFFSSFNGKNCEGNPRYISKYLLENKKNIKQVWGIRHNSKNDRKEEIKFTEWGSVKMIYEMATSRIWVDSNNLPIWVRKRRNQIFIQTWHGGLGVKKIVNDWKNINASHKKMTEHSMKMTNLFISNSTFLTNIYRNAFKYTGEIIEVGFPKNDVFFSSNDEKEKIRKRVFSILNIDENKKIVLYAPTFRENKRIDVYNINFKLLKHELEKKFKQEYTVVYRLHPEIRDLSKKFSENNPDCIDATFYDNMQDLIIATDVFITDYSSGIFDFALLKRPGFLFASDLDSYEEERGLYFDLRKMPFPLAQNNEDLKSIISNFDDERYKIELETFFKDTGLKDNAFSTQKVCKIIEDYIDKKKIKYEEKIK